MRLLLVTSVYQTIRLAISVEIANRVSFVDLQCTDTAMLFRATSQNPSQFQGRLFVKGQASVPNCATLMTVGQSQYDFQIPLGQCGMDRTGIVGQSQGTTWAITLVVSFHPLFLTKVDRAYHLICVYGAAPSGIVTNAIDVSMMPSSDVAQANGMPDCSYSIHLRDENGPTVRYANIGDKLVHVWLCQNLRADQQLWVRDCYVESEGRTDAFQIVDASGCAKDPVILANPIYRSSGEIVATHHAYKFADKPSLYFRCQISICQLNQQTGPCAYQQLPPNCPQGIGPGLVVPAALTTQPSSSGFARPISPSGNAAFEKRRSPISSAETTPDGATFAGQLTGPFSFDPQRIPLSYGRQRRELAGYQANERISDTQSNYGNVAIDLASQPISIFEISAQDDRTVVDREPKNISYPPLPFTETGGVDKEIAVCFTEVSVAATTAFGIVVALSILILLFLVMRLHRNRDTCKLNKQ